MTEESTSPWPEPVGSPVVAVSAADTGGLTPTLSDKQLAARTRRGRVLTGITVVALLAGSGLAYAGAASQGGDGGDVVVDVDNASAPVPSTVAPMATEIPPTTEPALTEPDDAEPAISPLADLLGEQYSVVPEAVEPRPRPVGMQIDAFDVSRFPIRAVGLEDDGQLEIPDETEIGWYQYGATAGRPGATVLAAHVSWNGTVGPFGQLGNLEPGNRVSVALDDGTTREYEVFERTIYGKLELPRDRIWRNTGPETLVLITCGGDFNPEIRRYRENIVVYAAPVG
jgi:hypothetical protein